MKCESCDKEISEEIIFCPFCGYKNYKPRNEQPPELSIDTPPAINMPIVIDVEPVEEPRKSGRGFPIVLSIIFGLASVVLLGIVLSNGQKVEQYESSIDQYRNENQELSSQVDQFENSISDLNSQLTQKDGQIIALEKQLSILKTQNTSYLSALNDAYENEIVIKVNSIYNSNYDGDKISDYLYSSSLQYLSFDYEILAKDFLNTNNGDEIEIKIIEPDGSLMQGDSSPYDCTATDTINGRYGYFGWGNSNGGVYKEGLYVIQFLYNGIVVGTEAVIIE